jgi:hypothetical protein
MYHLLEQSVTAVYPLSGLWAPYDSQGKTAIFLKIVNNLSFVIEKLWVFFAVDTEY